MKSNARGFTLIELMIAVAIVGILAAIATASYQNAILRSARAEARAALLNVQVAQEKVFLQYNRFAEDDSELAADPTSSAPGLRIPTTTSNGKYKISLSGTGADYTATATATGSQSKDTHCAQFQITNTGDKGGTTNADCWAR